MRLSQYKDDFYTYSGKLSSAVRNASLAGLGVVWIFRIGDGHEAVLPDELLLPITAFAGALAAEFLQYLAGTIIWFIFHRYHERKINSAEDDPNLSHAPILTLPIWTFFVVKVVSVLIGYASLGAYLYAAWS